MQKPELIMNFFYKTNKKGKKNIVNDITYQNFVNVFRGLQKKKTINEKSRCLLYIHEKKLIKKKFLFYIYKKKNEKISSKKILILHRRNKT
jgi:hypothetical protein